MSGTASDRLVSTTVLRDRREELRGEIEAQRKVRADDDPFFRIADWLLAEWEDAEREATRQYVTTSEAARLTGWSEQTLRKRAQAARNGGRLADGWEGLVVRAEGKEWSFCVSTIPVKSTEAA